jgi:Arc/MetJ-type ribon-helix-helix transcriptional regulator
VNSLQKICFCLTPEESDVVEEARQRLGKKGVLRNRSEVIRAAINYLEQLSDDELAAAAKKTQQMKPGRSKASQQT